MSQIYRIAILENNTKRLEKLATFLVNIPNVEVVLKSKNAEDFFKQWKTASLDVLSADLNFGSDRLTEGNHH